MNSDIFKFINDFHDSDLWKHLNGDTESKTNTRLLCSTRLENIIYKDLREQVKFGLDDIEADGFIKLDTFPSLIQDTFQALYSLNPCRTDTANLTINAQYINANILSSIMNSNKYSALKSLCEGQELPAYEAVTEFARCMFDKLDELLDMDAMEELNALEQQQAELKTKLTDAMERSDIINEESILEIAESIAGNNQQIEHLSQMIGRNIRKNNYVIQSAIDSAAQKAQKVSDIIKAWGNGDSSPEAIRQNAELLRRVQSSPKLREIVKYLGRYMELFNNARKSSYTYGRGEKYDVVLGNDYAHAISSEYAYLALPETVPLFIQKVQRKTLKQYRRRERTTKGCGDVIVCIDESGSMEGDSISWAKAVALVLLEYATQNSRRCAMVRFASAGEIVTHIYAKGKYTTDDVLNFAESFIGGGTDFETPLTQAVELIECEGFENADIVFITDGECSISDEFASDFRDKRNQLKFNVTGIIIDTDEADIGFSLTPFCEKVYRLSEMTGNEIASEIITRFTQ